MSEKINAEYVPDEKKVWIGLSQEYFTPEPELGLPPGIYFTAIEELQGAWVSVPGQTQDRWEEAEGGTEEWEEPTGEFIQGVAQYRTVSREIKRARRYVVKRYTLPGEKDKFGRPRKAGRVVNVFDESFAGPRKYPVGDNK